MRKLRPLLLVPLLAFLSLPLGRPAEAAALSCHDVPLLLGAMERQHYSVKSISPELKRRAVEQFIEQLDPSKTLLLESDVQHLRTELTTVFDTMRQGKCDVLDKTFGLIISRAAADLKLARSFLGKGYKLDESAQIVVDPDKRTYAKTPQERANRVRNMVHFQISNYLVTGLPLEKAKAQLVHRYELVIKRLRERQNEGKLPGMFAEAAATAFDPHSDFMSADTLADFQIMMHLSLEGIGAVLSSQDGFTTIESLVPGGQADKSHMLRTKDKIVAVAQDGEPAVSVIDMDLQDVVKMIRGKKGTKVTLSVLRESGQGSKAFDVTIVRDKIDVKSQAAKITYETRNLGGKQLKVGVLDLPSFYGGDDDGRSSYEDVKKLLGEAKANHVDALVLDLSKNGGGLLEDAVRIAGLFIKRGAVVATKDADQKVRVLADEDDATVYAGPLVVLVSRGSASASEILAGALKDYRRALIVGSDRTFGKGSVQLLSPLPRDLGALKVTTALFFLPDGASTQEAGVTSDIRVPSLLDGYDLGEAQLDYALPSQKIDGFASKTANAPAGSPAHYERISDDLVTALATRSQERVGKEPVFAKIAQEISEMKKHRGVVRISELRRRAKDGLDDADSAEYKKLESVVVGEAVNIAADLATSSSLAAARP